MIAPIRLRPGDELYASSRMLFTRRLSVWAASGVAVAGVAGAEDGALMPNDRSKARAEGTSP